MRATTPANEPGIDELYELLAADAEADAVSVILKLRGETCDADCLYCFEKRKEAPGGASISVEQVDRIATLFAGRPLMVELHGGEPLTLPKQQMRSILDFLRMAPNVLGVVLQTNGIRIDDDWVDLFDTHYPGLGITVSLDGDQQGNQYRIGYDGAPIYDRVVAAIDLLKRRGKQVGITTVVTSRLLGRAPQIIDHLSKFDNVHAINLIGCFDPTVAKPTAVQSKKLPVSRQLQLQAINDGQPPAWATSPDDYAEFVLAATQHWIRTGLWRRVNLAPTVAIVRKLRNLDVRNCHYNARKCHHVFTAYPDGRLGSCDELPWPRATLTTLRKPRTLPLLIDAQQNSSLLGAGRRLMEKCTSCDYKQSCGGGCVSHRLAAVAAHGDDDSYCRHRARLIDGVASLLAVPQDDQALVCRTITWLRQDPNVMKDVAGFLRRWDDHHAPRTPATIKVSPQGNINTVGQPGTHEADDLDPLHPQWREGIEARIWPLVEAITSAGYVTYDSCGGHPAYDSPPELRVGILPRHAQDNVSAGRALCRAIHQARPAVPTSVHIGLFRNELACATTSASYPSLDLRIRPTPGHTNDDFYRDATTAVDTLCSVLAAGIHPNPPAACGCHPAEK